MPPVHSGIVPAALPAFSEPIGVRFLPSWAALSAETFACASPVTRTAALTHVASAVFLIELIVCPPRLIRTQNEYLAVKEMKSRSPIWLNGVPSNSHMVTAVTVAPLQEPPTGTRATVSPRPPPQNDV